MTRLEVDDCSNAVSDLADTRQALLPFPGHAHANVPRDLLVALSL